MKQYAKTEGKRKFTKLWKLNTLLNNQWMKEVTKEIENTQINENENITYQNLRDTAKAVIKRKFTAIDAYLKKQNLSNQHLTLQLKNPVKEQTKPQISRRKKIRKVEQE